MVSNFSCQFPLAPVTGTAHNFYGNKKPLKQVASGVFV